MRIRKYESHIKQLTTQEQEIVGVCASDPHGKYTIFDMTAKFWSSKHFTQHNLLAHSCLINCLPQYTMECEVSHFLLGQEIKKVMNRIRIWQEFKHETIPNYCVFSIE